MVILTLLVTGKSNIFTVTLLQYMFQPNTAGRFWLHSTQPAASNVLAKGQRDTACCGGSVRDETKRPQHVISTCWNFTLYMLESLLEKKHALATYGTVTDLPQTLTAPQWASAENVITLLFPFKKAGTDHGKGKKTNSNNNNTSLKWS